MVIGLDLGASAFKIAGVDGEKIAFMHTDSNRSCSADELLRSVLAENGVDISEVSAIALTGVGAEKCSLNYGSLPATLVPEIIATGEGGTWLAKRDRAIVISLGTGTALILAENGKYSHVGGTGVGSGTLRGLSKKLFNISSLFELFPIAEQGDRKKVDVQIGDLFSGTDTLPLDLTASNLAKCRDDAEDKDWAAGIINMVLEVAGSHAVIACGGYGIDTVIITGGLSRTRLAQKCYQGFSELYKLNYIIPQHSDCATAIGAARRVILGA
ncbi:MAG: hypothetical protein RR147_00775 [Oscillospiraceae bacterium]